MKRWPLGIKGFDSSVILQIHCLLPDRDPNKQLPGDVLIPFFQAAALQSGRVHGAE